MKMKIAEDDFEATGSSPSPRTFAPSKARLNKLQQVSAKHLLLNYLLKLAT